MRKVPRRPNVAPCRRVPRDREMEDYMMMPSRPWRQPQYRHAFFSGAATAMGAVALWFATMRILAWYIHLIG